MRLIITLFTLFCTLASMQALAANRYYIANGTALSIDEHGVCQKVSNNVGAEIMVPTKFPAEWLSFRTHLPTNVTLATCAPAICNLPWGGTLAHSADVTTYQNSSESCGNTCTSETRTCTDGTLSGTYTNQNCSVTACAACSSTTINWSSCNALSGSMTHGQTKTVSNAASGYTGTRDLSCNNGTISQSGGSCTSGCGGITVGGYCWYKSEHSESCDTACASHGGYNEATRTYAGSSGSPSNCKAVATAFGHGSEQFSTASCNSVTGTYTDDNVGCIFDPGLWGVPVVIHCAAPPTNSSEWAWYTYRFCACNN